MTEPRYRFGAGGLGTEKVFDFEKAESVQVDDERIREFEAAHNFLPDAQKHFDETLEKNGLRRVEVLENGIKFPSLNEWIAHKVGSGESWIRSYPCFVRDESGKLFFCKTRIKPTSMRIGGGLAAEAETLFILKDLPAAKFVNYIPEDEGNKTLEMVLLEPIKFSEGHVLLPREWNAPGAKNVVSAIKQLEKTPFDALGLQTESPEKAVGDLLQRVDVMLKPEFKQKIPAILSEYKSVGGAAFAHRDLWPKNIIFGIDKTNPSVRFVDWELSGAGFIGEDAGRMLWGITTGAGSPEEVRQAVLSEYLNEPDAAARLARCTQLRFGVMLETLWRLDDKSKAVQSDPKLLQGAMLQSYIENVHAQADMLFQLIGQKEQSL